MQECRFFLSAFYPFVTSSRGSLFIRYIVNCLSHTSAMKKRETGIDSEDYALDTYCDRRRVVFNSILFLQSKYEDLMTGSLNISSLAFDYKNSLLHRQQNFLHTPPSHGVTMKAHVVPVWRLAIIISII